MIPPVTCETRWPHFTDPEHFHRCLRADGHGRYHLCRCGTKLDVDSVITPEELDPAVRERHRQKIAEHLDFLHTFKPKRRT